MKRTFLLSAAMSLIAVAANASETEQAARSYLKGSVMPWANAPVLIEAIVAQNARTAGYDASKIDELDKTWRSEVGAGASALVDGVLTGAAAEFLREQVEGSGGAITEVFIMDHHGLNVAASAPTSDYWQGDEAKFQETFPNGADAVHVSEIEFDESSQSYQAQLSITLTDDTGAPVGAMTIGIDADALL
ncbi:MAG: hypothetical protein AAFN79_21595 [Pseudomonadota bacterium]